jgi:hypothetical protein
MTPQQFVVDIEQTMGTHEYVPGKDGIHCKFCILLPYDVIHWTI